MNKKQLGIVLIVIGVALAVWGFNIYDSVGSQLGRAFSGNAPIEAWLGMVGGVTCIVMGILKVK